MKLKIIKDSTIFDLGVGTVLDLKRDGGFATAQVNFHAPSKDLLTRFDRVELFDTTPVTLPIVAKIAGTDRTFTTNSVSFSYLTGSVNVRIELGSNFLRVVSQKFFELVDDVIVATDINLTWSYIKKSGQTVWSAEGLIVAGDVLPLTEIVIGTTQWVVAKSTRTLTDFSSNWLYNMLLVSPNKLLFGIVMPNLAFTQSLSGELTVAQVVSKMLKKCKTRLWQYRNSTEYTLSSAGAAKLGMTAPEDIYTGMSLGDFLVRVGKIIDAFPIVNSWNQIDFRYFNDSSATYTPSYTSIEFTDDIEGFATEIVMDAENVDLGGVLASYPTPTLATYVVPSNLGDITSADNAEIELPYPVKKVTKITLQTFAPPDEDYPDIMPAIINTEVLTEGSGFVEKTVWDALMKDGFWGFIPLPLGLFKKNQAYYEYGSKKISNLKAIKEWLILSAVITKYGVCIEYEPLIAMQMSRKNTVTLDNDAEWMEYVNQDEKTVDRISAVKKMESDIRRKASTSVAVEYQASALPVVNSRHRVLGSNYATTRLVVKIMDDHYIVSAHLSSDFTMESQFVGVDQEPRKYEISSKQTVTRVIRLTKKYKIQVSELGEVLSSQTLTFLTDSGGISFLYPLLKDLTSTNAYKPGYLMALCQWVYTTPTEDAGAIATVVPTAYAPSEKRLSILFNMRDNTSVDFFKRFDTLITRILTFTTEAVSAMVTDENGELSRVDVKIVPVEAGEQIQELTGSLLEHQVQEFLRYTYPYVTEDYFDDGFDLDGDIFPAIELTGDNALYLDKDRREALNFQLDFDLTEGDGVTIHEGFTSKMAFFKSLGSGSDASLRLLAFTGGAIACTYNSCEVISASRVKIQFTPITGGLTRDVIGIEFLCDGVVVLTKGFDTDQVDGSQETIYITIGDD